MFSRFFKQNAPNNTSIYSQIGGEKAVLLMANRFYDIMESNPAAAELFAMHPQPLTRIRNTFYEFLSGWLGGPALFVEKYGHPRLRARHLPFRIDTKMRDQWLLCMYQVLDEMLQDEWLSQPIYHELRQRFTALAHHMINQAN
ncbi:hemoglobin-like oxygen-binding protein [Aliidiomarina taiwanensis]|uniref:Hemoglobin-like oxygen-binding protein n=1 Tax=Aliidiomarina taiwanensis TaxID=946228 RepID=A0A432X8K4_9GAMM|nr:group II truncated hemoglobin [Aliidiomarina taiwanensis]RUO43664.1 hemoglobin-like oxygen-binding protein [Aliidiomarina taiwanensis]